MTPPDLQIQKATEADIPELVPLLVQVTPTSIEEALPAFHRMSQYPDYHVYLVREEQALIGTFTLLVMDNIGHGGAPIGVVENVVVDQQRRGQGIGRQMMAFAAEVSREQGCYKLILSSNVKLQEAHGFYESLGFIKQGYAFNMEL